MTLSYFPKGWENPYFASRIFFLFLCRQNSELGERELRSTWRSNSVLVWSRRIRCLSLRAWASEDMTFRWKSFSKPHSSTPPTVFRYTVLNGTSKMSWHSALANVPAIQKDWELLFHFWVSHQALRRDDVRTTDDPDQAENLMYSQKCSSQLYNLLQNTTPLSPTKHGIIFSRRRIRCKKKKAIFIASSTSLKFSF